jgi:hypothetical protein
MAPLVILWFIALVVYEIVRVLKTSEVSSPAMNVGSFNLPGVVEGFLGTRFYGS